MSVPREFVKEFYGRLPTPSEWKDYLKMKLEEAEEGWDSSGDFEFSIGRAQDYIKSWPQVFNEYGGV